MQIKNIMLIGGLSAATVLAGLTGCQSWGQGGSDVRTEGRVVDDNRITSKVKSELNNEPVYKFKDVEVRTFNGVVQLSGFVMSQEQKQRAGQIAQTIPGVARVVNNLTLKSETMPTGRQNNNQNPEGQPKVDADRSLQDPNAPNQPNREMDVDVDVDRK